MYQNNFFSEPNVCKQKTEPHLPNIIFLDIDGVLCDGKLPEHEDEFLKVNYEKIIQCIPTEILQKINRLDLIQTLTFSTKAMENICKLCEQTSAKVVISSAWRKKYTLKELTSLFLLTPFGKYIVDCIPILDKGIVNDRRGLEIESWLQQNSVNSFVILDDCKYDIELLFKERFVHCETLFTSDNLYQCAEKILQNHLNAEPNTTSLLN